MVKVKICGITNPADAKASVDAGCDALGFMFYKKSRRYINPANAKTIIKDLPGNVVKIGVFVNDTEKNIKHIAKLCHLDMLQFHGNESPEFCGKFKNFRIIKVFRVKNEIDMEKILKYKAFAYLFDTFVKHKPGGTGKQFNWKLSRHLSGVKAPIFLSGGLDEKNVKKAIKVAHPDWVDASSGLETKPGIKDHMKIKKFVSAARATH